MAAHCDCGAPAGPLGECADYYNTILAEEQLDPDMYKWHAVVVCVYLLQHPSRGHEKYLDSQYRWLQFYLDQGIDAVQRLRDHQVARNNHRSRAAYDMSPLDPYLPLPAGGPPARFRTGFCDLPYGEGGFILDGHETYGHRMKALAEATLDAWKNLGPGSPSRG
ncbi:unnamed protein product [[Actinomadura] parvosata subsp. kistnae]|uniref:Uncharacterized protein n=1 Tax=[Actinomadura] parvosata subsp. kistnae TaxID=1909395 RepID=A0A1V0AHP6_9ACTN|nr:DUF5946 family protein [Nonomuraea sp. ATCC 55076]AQZ69744.1 hypothetical protein BKM31_57155 [Nonomuraea sp. ATCC 55076]SPL91527.1 unnamed protein product [Actinomadura parvosata subsp. kistnae]